MTIIVKVERNKKLRDLQLYFSFDDREQGVEYRSNPVCIETSDIKTLELELTGSLNQILGQLTASNED